MVLKRIFLLFILPAFFIALPDMVSGQQVRKVVIDAGHGGHDPGARGKHSSEKDITLAIALKAGKLIEQNLKDVEVIYTRKTDVFVELFRRARIANEARADLFISIHCNANPSTSPYGAETYVMGLDRSSANLAVAQAENAAILLEDDYHVQYEGFDPSSPEGYIFFSMLQNAFLDQSLNLASGIQHHMRTGININDRGVKQAGFLVLYKTTMPSVLVETGFISNLKEEKVLNSDEGQQRYAEAIFRAVRDYKQSVERYANAGKPPQIQSAPVETVENNDKNENHAAVANPNKVSFKVQFMISKHEISTTSKQFKGIENISYYKHQGMYKYTAGDLATEKEALELRKHIVKQGYNDAFVVAFKDGSRISMEEARQWCTP
ncbi:MAG: N-acetylmuramoyl-L-alanine amidase [Lentimicrobiaceae bacterium]|nr:N-acetylmuramoyl-L-alanine amidase [Lentimicrobiaceae bacterium]